MSMIQRWAMAIWLHRALALLVVLCLSGSAVAQDALLLSGIWIEPVTVDSIQNGQVHYQNEYGTPITRPVHVLEGLRLGRYPAMGEAQDAIDRGDDRSAEVWLKQVGEQAHEPWLLAYTGAQRVQALARLDEPEQAVGVYVDMVVSGTDMTFLVEPPVDVLAGADAAVRLRVAKLLETAKVAVDADRGALLQELIDATGKPSPELIGAVATTPAVGAGSGPRLTSSVPPGSIVNLYRKGRYPQALLAADEALTQPGRTASELYLKGMAQLALAEQGSDPDGYKSAGLSFMRVVTYYPRSAVAGPAWLEAGYVHQKIERTDLAAKLYRRAQPLIHEDEDPAYFMRMNELMTGLDKASVDE